MPSQECTLSFAKFKIYCFGTILFLLVLVLPAFSQSPLQIATDANNPPFSYFDKDQNRWFGFEVDLITELCQQIKQQCQLIDSVKEDRIKGVLNHSYDIIMASQEVLAPLKEQLAFTSHYYSHGVKFVRPKSIRGRVSYKTLNDNVVGVKVDSSAHQFLLKKFKNVTIKPYDTHESAYQDLLANEIDLVLADKFVQYKWLQTQPDYHMVGPSYTNKRYFNKVAIGLRKTDVQLQRQLNDAIKQMRDSGHYKEIRKRYFPFAIYGR